MDEFKQIDAQQAKQLLESGALLADIRDHNSYQLGHINGAKHLDEHSVQPFIDQADLDIPLVIYCHHGISSLSAAQFMIDRGFDRVYSLAGGFEEWQQRFPNLCQQD